jgi:ABC-type multidrug transport system ATPase subunit/ABC-type multidrug transport system permease subunit
VTETALDRREAEPVILHDGRRIPVGSALTIGRDPGSDIHLASNAASRQHAAIGRTGEEWWIADLDSRNGTRLNGELLIGERRALRSGDSIVIAGNTMRFVAPVIELPVGSELRSRVSGVLPVQATRLKVGRDEANDLVLDDPNVSRFHAEVFRTGHGHATIRDLGSRNGTRVNDELVTSKSLEIGAQIAIGPFRLIFDGTDLVAHDERGALRLDANRIAVEIDGRVILQELSLSILPGEFVVIIGPSGAGKSTLLRALAGVSTPSAGEVLISGEPVLGRRTEIGYVPQDEIVHERLTVREALRFAARLRLPADATAESVEALVDRALSELELEARADVRIGAISGGQRKRVGVATELLNRPSLLFLDEPTTGLDPGLENRLMMLMRELAGERSVVTVTHATQSLDLCDRLIVMGEGGILCFEGAPGDALPFFDVDNYAGIYTALNLQPGSHWAARREPRIQPELPPQPAGPKSRKAVRVRGSWTQMRVLARRYALLMRRDPRNLVLLLGQAPLFGLAIAGLYSPDTFDLRKGNPGNAAQMLFFLVVIVVWMGAIAAAREIVRERAVFEAERAVGVRVRTYIVAKLSVLSVLCAAQVGLLLAVTLTMRPLHEPLHAYVQLVFLGVLTALTAVAMGLTISAIVRSQEQATSAIPLALVPTLLFGGAIVPVASMTTPLKVVSGLVFARWAYANAGEVIDMNHRIAIFGHSRASVFGKHFFVVGTPAVTLILLGFCALFLACVAWRLRDHKTKTRAARPVREAEADSAVTIPTV